MKKLEPESVLEYHILHTKGIDNALKTRFVNEMRGDWKRRMKSETIVAFNAGYACARETPRLLLLNEVTENVDYWDIRNDRYTIREAWEKEDEEERLKWSRSGCLVVITVALIFLTAIGYVIWSFC